MGSGLLSSSMTVEDADECAPVDILTSCGECNQETRDLPALKNCIVTPNVEGIEKSRVYFFPSRVTRAESRKTDTVTRWCEKEKKEFKSINYKQETNAFKTGDPSLLV